MLHFCLLNLGIGDSRTQYHFPVQSPARLALPRPTAYSLQPDMKVYFTDLCPRSLQMYVNPSCYSRGALPLLITLPNHFSYVRNDTLLAALYRLSYSALPSLDT